MPAPIQADPPIAGAKTPDGASEALIPLDERLSALAGYVDSLTNKTGIGGVLLIHIAQIADVC
jgi:hypothetical protein